MQVIQRGSLFSWVEEGEQLDEEYQFWGLCSAGGLFETPDEAEKNAIDEVQWLRNQISN